MTADSRELVRESVIWPFFSSDLGKRMAAAQREGRLKKESQFVIGIPARQMGDFNSDELVLVQGIIDAFFEEDGELVLVDYKTDYVEKEETLRERYGIQLDIDADGEKEGEGNGDLLFPPGRGEAAARELLSGQIAFQLIQISGDGKRGIQDPFAAQGVKQAQGGGNREICLGKKLPVGKNLFRRPLTQDAAIL